MDIINSFRNHRILKSATEVQEICKPLKKYQLAEKKFGIYHGFLMPFSDGPLREVCYFATTNPNPNICNFYLQNIDALKIFKMYFTEKAAMLIKKIEQDKLPSIGEHLKNNEIINRQNLLPYNELV